MTDFEHLLKFILNEVDTNRFGVCFYIINDGVCNFSLLASSVLE